MKDPYQEAFKQISDAIIKINNMIVELGKRTLTIKEYEDFITAIEEKEDKKDIIKGDKHGVHNTRQRQ